MKIKISPSSINLMNECARCFWLYKKTKWRRPSGPFPSLPSGMDRILKDYFDNQNTKEMDELKLDSFEDKELLNKWRSNFKGIRLEGEKYILMGAVDNIATNGKKLVVIDYKTRGFPLKENTADSYQNQLDIYNYLLVENGYKVESYGVLIFYIPLKVTKNGNFQFERVIVKRKIDLQNAEKLFKSAIKLLNGKCPKDKCRWCENGN